MRPQTIQSKILKACAQATVTVAETFENCFGEGTGHHLALGIGDE